MYNARSVFGYCSKQEGVRERDKARDVSPTVLIITRIDTNFPLLCFPRNARAKNILWLMGSPSPLCGDKLTDRRLHTPRALCASFNPFSHYIIYTRTYIYRYIFYHIARRLYYYYYYYIDLILSVPSPPPFRLGSNKPARVAPPPSPHRAPLARRKTSLSHYFPATTIRLNYLRVLYTHTANRHQYRARAGRGLGQFDRLPLDVCVKSYVTYSLLLLYKYSSRRIYTSSCIRERDENRFKRCRESGARCLRQSVCGKEDRFCDNYYERVTP